MSRVKHVRDFPHFRPAAERLEQRVLLSAGTIASGQTVAQRIAPGEVDTFMFIAGAGDAIVIAAATTSGGLDPQVELSRVGGEVLATHFALDFSGVHLRSRAPVAGEYTVTIRDQGGGSSAGTYNVSLAIAAARPVADSGGEPIAPGQSLAGEVFRGDLDVLTLTAAVGDVLTVTASTTDGGLDPQIHLFGPSGGLAGTDWDDEFGGAEVQYKVPLAGTYTIVLGDHGGGGSGAYNVTLGQSPGAPPPAALLDDVVYAYGTDANDVITVRSDGVVVFVNHNGAVTNFAASKVTGVHLFGGAGNDVLSLTETALANYVDAGLGNDRVSGGSGKDTLTGGAGKDRISGGGGDDRLNGSGGHDVLQGGLNGDRLYGGAGNDLLSGQSHVDRLFGEDGDDTLIGGTANDKLYGQAGDDLLVGNAGTDLLDGGDGIDTGEDDATDIRTLIEQLIS